MEKGRTVSNPSKKILLALGSLFLLEGCFLLEAVEDRQGATTVLPNGFSGVATCAVKGFAYFVHPKLKANCASCHSGNGPGVGSFAASDVFVAYGAAKARANLGLPRGSRMVERSGEAGHGGGCATCGDAWGTVLTDAITDWSKAEANNEVTCNSLPDLTTEVEQDFDGGTYNPGAGLPVTVIAEGLIEFSKTNGIHSLLKTNCAECHAPGKQAAFAPFGQTDAEAAYKAAKPRVNFIDPTTSKILTRASTDAHCGPCGTSTLVNALLGVQTPTATGLYGWRVHEAAGATEQRVTLISKAFDAVTVPMTGVTSKTLTWNLGSDVTPANPALTGAQFRVTVERQGSPYQYIYRVKNPVLITAGVPIEVQDIRFIVNGAEDPLMATFSLVNTVIGSNQTSGPLTTTPALVACPTPSGQTVPVCSSGDTVGFKFFILKQQ